MEKWKKVSWQVQFAILNHSRIANPCIKWDQTRTWFTSSALAVPASSVKLES